MSEKLLASIGKFSLTVIDKKKVGLQVIVGYKNVRIPVIIKIRYSDTKSEGIGYDTRLSRYIGKGVITVIPVKHVGFVFNIFKWPFRVTPRNCHCAHGI